MKILLLITLPVLFMNCSRINQQSRDYYESKKGMRHGVYPIAVVKPEKLDQSAVDRGEKIYNQHCLSCHGKSGEGDGPQAPKGTANLRRLAQEVRDFKFYMSISQWQGDMPGWKEPLSSSDRADLEAYIKSLR